MSNPAGTKATAILPSRQQLESALVSVANPKRAEYLQKYFKTGEGQYGAGDIFLGISVPIQRKIARRYRTLPRPEIARLLASPIHEHRFVALEILVAQFEYADEPQREKLVRFYLRQAKKMNNWDLVDAAAPNILGEYLKMHPRRVLDTLAASSNLWERRIAIVATLALIRERETKDTFRIARKLLADEHDLIHKAVGWALRETGKVSRPDLLLFIQTNYARMPRTALRYAIEHFPPAQRKRILTGDFLKEKSRQPNPQFTGAPSLRSKGGRGN